MRISDWSSDVCSSDLVRLTGKVLAVTGGERARSMTIDTDGDGSVDAIVQLGPVVRGTALRDALGTRTFNDFDSQIDYARYARLIKDRKRPRLKYRHKCESRMPSSAWTKQNNDTIK